MKKTPIIIKKLKKHFGEVKAVDEITFSLSKGEIHGLLGPNGAGKTTTIKCIMGLLEPQGGEIKVLGYNPFTDPVAVKAKIGFVAEEANLYKSMSPKELFNFIASIRQLNEGKTTLRVKELMESLDAMEYYNTPIITLSKGNQQKIQIIAAMMHDPPILLLDEPLAGLDAKTSKIVKELLNIYTDSGGSILLSTHIMEQAAELCDQISIINKGKLVADGTLEELRDFADATGESLENVFLRLTEQDKSVKDVIMRMRDAYKQKKSSED